VHAVYPHDPIVIVISLYTTAKINQELAFFTDEAWFYMNGRVNTQNDRYWSTENPHLLHEISHHDVKVGVWCALNARRIIDLRVFWTQF
jgi:hypothetical protein